MGYKKIEWDEDKYRLMESAVLDGRTPDEIGVMFGTTAKGMFHSFKYNGYAKKRYETAKAKVLADCSHNLRKIADGFKETTRTYSVPFGDYDMTKMHKEAMIKSLEDENYDEFWGYVVKCVDDKKRESIREEEKYYPPDLKANTEILKAHNEEVWDIEGRRKKIPQSIVHVTLNGPKSKKALKADFEVVDE